MNPNSTHLTPGGSALAFEHGSLVVKVYAPRDTDPQQPHTRDEAYVVISGRGTFVHGERRDAFEGGEQPR